MNYLVGLLNKFIRIKIINIGIDFRAAKCPSNILYLR